MEQVRDMLKACIVSRKGGVPLTEIEAEYTELVGTKIPYAKYGFASLKDFLHSINEIRIICNPDGSVVLKSRDSKTSHLSELVERQKVTTKARNKKPGLSRMRGGVRYQTNQKLTNSKGVRSGFGKTFSNHYYRKGDFYEQYNPIDKKCSNYIPSGYEKHVTEEQFSKLKSNTHSFFAKKDVPCDNGNAADVEKYENSDENHDDYEGDFEEEDDDKYDFEEIKLPKENFVKDEPIKKCTKEQEHSDDEIPALIHLVGNLHIQSSKNEKCLKTANQGDLRHTSLKRSSKFGSKHLQKTCNDVNNFHVPPRRFIVKPMKTLLVTIANEHCLSPDNRKHPEVRRLSSLTKAGWQACDCIRPCCCREEVEHSEGKRTSGFKPTKKHPPVKYYEEEFYVRQRWAEKGVNDVKQTFRNPKCAQEIHEYDDYYDEVEEEDIPSVIPLGAMRKTDSKQLSRLVEHISTQKYSPDLKRGLRKSLEDFKKPKPPSRSNKLTVTIPNFCSSSPNNRRHTTGQRLSSDFASASWQECEGITPRSSRRHTLYSDEPLSANHKYKWYEE